MSKESIIDTSKPNPGRMYDYWLGGHHNFEVDRQAAEHLINVLPVIPKGARLQRWCLQDIATELTQKRGYDVVIDFASGLPTNDHVHHVVPPGTTVIYSDYDPVVVEYAREILADTPNVYFFQADARRPEELLNRAEVKEILGNKRDVAIIYWGVSSFLDDDSLRHASQVLYEWTGPRACWAFNAQGAESDVFAPGLIQMLEVYKQMGAPLMFRALKTFGPLLRPWTPDEMGFVSLMAWHGMDNREFPEQFPDEGAAGGGFGAYLVKA
jgi:hypothetical protein